MNSIDIEIIQLIQKYSEIYSGFENLQKRKILSGGDQKTGVIGEYYVKTYLERKYTGKITECNYANPGQPFDISYKLNKRLYKVQVKTISDHSETRTIAQLNLDKRPFDHLYLLSLNNDFKPNRLYICTYDSIKRKLDARKDDRTILKGTIMIGNGKKGSWMYDFDNREDMIEEMRRYLEELFE